MNLKDYNIDIKKTLECGQIFRFYKNDETYVTLFGDDIAIIDENGNVRTNNKEECGKFFNLSADYSKIKDKWINSDLNAKAQDFLKNAIQYGDGIRLLKQGLIETTIGFIISANNNIKRIQGSLNKLCLAKGETKELDGIKYNAFPSVCALSEITKEEWTSYGVGYRAESLVKTCKFLNENKTYLDELKQLPVAEAREKLIQLSGVGRKVSDCILLFAFGKMEVFPVDTWIEKIFTQHFRVEYEMFNSKCSGKNLNREEISKWLVDTFKKDSGIVQQWVFNYKRNYKG